MASSKASTRMETMLGSVEVIDVKDNTGTGPLQRACEPCRAVGSIKESKRYCEDCQTYMCLLCGLVHRRSTATHHHNVTSGRQEEQIESQKTGLKASLAYCEQHNERVIEWYCADHDDYICKTCLSKNHKQCDFKHMSQMEDLPKFDKRMADMVRSLANLRSRIQNLETTRKQNIYELQKLRGICEDEVKKFRKKISDLVEKLEKEMLSDIDCVIKDESNIASKHMKMCSTLIPQIEADSRIATDAKLVENNAAGNITAHKLSKRLKEASVVVSDMEREAHNVWMEFQPDRTLVDLLNSVEYIGALNIEFPGSRSQSFCGSPGQIFKCLSEKEVVSSKVLDAVSGGITGSTFMPDEQLVLADNARNTIMLLDRKLEIKEKLQLTVQPWDVTTNSAKDVIVTIPSTKSLQYVDIYPRLRAVKALKTVKPCYGVVVHNADIYVSLHNNPGEGEIQVLDKRGKLKRQFGIDVHDQCMFISPFYITVGARGSVFVSDTKGRVVCFSEIGEILYDIRTTNVKFPRGMVVDKEDYLVLCCEDAKAVQMYKKTGAMHRVLLGSSDGMSCPMSVAYRNVDNTLIVTMYKGKTFAYKLK